MWEFYWCVGSSEAEEGGEGGEEEWRAVKYYVEEGTRCDVRIKTGLKRVMRSMMNSRGNVGGSGGDGFNSVAVRWEVLTTGGVS